MSKGGNGAKASGYGASAPQNKLHFGDNLDVLRNMPAESVDLIYLDPPFNSKAVYGVIYGTKRGGPSQAQSHAFKDMWTWGPDAQRALNETADRHLQAGALLDSFQRVFPGDNMLAYLAMMAVRLIEMQRVLKETGSLYLHCDPTASHYLRVLLDAIFGPAQFRTEISWRRQSAHNDAKQGRVQYGNVRDVILFYTKGRTWTWNWLYTLYDKNYVRDFYKHIEPGSGRRYRLSDLTGPGGAAKGNPRYEVMGVTRYWRFSKEKMNKLIAEGRIVQTRPGVVPAQKRYLDEMPGVPLQNDWNDISPAVGNESLGYQTQKPLALLERIVAASSNESDVVLDPFCGCGTAIEAAQRLKRKWIGIDVTYLAIHVIEGRLVKAFGPEIKNTYSLFGQPRDADDARALAARDWLEFQKWAVFQLGGLPKDKPGADGGIDGIIRYHRVGIEQPNRAVVSVKGGEHVGVDAIHKLKSVVQREKAEFGVLVCLDGPTKAMEKEALSEGEVGPTSRRVPKLQIVTVDQIFNKHPIEIPGTLDPPEISRLAPPIPGQKKRTRKIIEGQTEMLLALENPQAPYEANKPSKRGRQIRPVDIEVIRPDKRKTK
jgi:DNA modification methylase